MGNVQLPGWEDLVWIRVVCEYLRLMCGQPSCKLAQIAWLRKQDGEIVIPDNKHPESDREVSTVEWKEDKSQFDDFVSVIILF